MIALPNEFASFIQSHGVTPPIQGVRYHDKPTRFNVKTGKVDSGASGWIVLFSDELGGVFGNWSDGLEVIWQAEKVSTMTDQERDQMLKERAIKKAQIEAEETHRHNEGVALANDRYRKAVTGDGIGFKYLLRKYESNFKAKADNNQALILPIRDLFSGDVLSVQSIAIDDTGASVKRFQSGVKLSRFDHYGLIIDSYDLTKQTRLNDLQGHDVVYVVEGVATGCTVFDAMQAPVICSFSAGNMQAVARVIRSALPDTRIVICADNDTTKADNVGLAKAITASKTVGGFVVVASGSNGTDFNDDFVNALQGNEANRSMALDSVKASILRQIDQQETTETTETTDKDTNSPLVTTSKNLAIMGGLDAPIQLFAVCQTENARELASKLLRRVFVEPMATMLHAKAQINTTTLTIKKQDVSCPVLWLAFGDSKDWLDQANNLGMMTLNDDQLHSVAHSGGIKQVASGINEALRLALSGKVHTVPTVTNKPIFGDAGRFMPKNTLENWGQLLEWEGVKLRYNVMTREVDFRASWCNGKYGYSDMKNNVDLARLDSAGERYDLKAGNKIASHIRVLSGENAYHPVKDWIDRKEWDGVGRFADFTKTLTTDNEAISNELKIKLLGKWFIGAVQAIYEAVPSEQHGVIVLQGKQGLGKTRWIKSLCPIDGAVKDGLRIDSSNVDSIRQATRQWITELGELDGTFKKSDIAHLKAFLTQQSDSYRLPYALTMEDLPRRTAFIASVNDPKYLIDETGNRRFWTIPVTAINHNHNFDMQQVWAEIKVLWERGGVHWLDDDELEQLNEHNQGYEASNPYMEAIGAGFYFDQTDKFSNMMTSSQIAVHCGFLAPNKQTTNGFSKALHAMGLIDKRTTIKGVSGRYYAMPQCR